MTNGKSAPNVSGGPTTSASRWCPGPPGNGSPKSTSQSSSGDAVAHRRALGVGEVVGQAVRSERSASSSSVTCWPNRWPQRTSAAARVVSTSDALVTAARSSARSSSTACVSASTRIVVVAMTPVDRMLLAVPLRAGDFGAAETAAAVDPNAAGAQDAWPTARRASWRGGRQRGAPAGWRYSRPPAWHRSPACGSRRCSGALRWRSSPEVPDAASRCPRPSCRSPRRDAPCGS